MGLCVLSLNSPKEKRKKKCAAILHFLLFIFLIPLLFPKDSESLKILDIHLWEVGAKRHLNGNSKVNRHTNRQTDGQTF